MITPDPITYHAITLPPWADVCSLIRDLTQAGATVTLDGAALQRIMRDAREPAEQAAFATKYSRVMSEMGGAR